MNNSEYEDFASFATRRISTLTKISGHLKVFLVIKLLSIISFMYILTYLYILAEISAYHLQLKCMGGHFISGPPLHREYYRTL